MKSMRHAAVAGTFYPGDPDLLSRQVKTLLQAVPAQHNQMPGKLKALIVPHAGYVYSGAIAAQAYTHLKALRHTIKRVVLLGPSHRVHVNGLALPGAEFFVTPLGIVPVDKKACEAIQALPQVQEIPMAHQWEHSLEVQLPFLQTVLDSFTLVPLAVGEAGSTDVAEVLDVLWGGEETLIVISSDLSHYLPYNEACKIDKVTAEAILALKPLHTLDQACGGIPVNGLLQIAQQRGLQSKLLDLRNSGDTAGDKERVVGYGSFGFYAAH